MSHTLSATALSGELSKFIDDGVTNNYAAWKTKSIHSLRSWNLWRYIDGPDSVPPIIPVLREETAHEGTDEDGTKRKFIIEGNKVEYEAKLKEAQPWLTADQLTLSKIINCVSDNVVPLVRDAPHAKQAWESLRSVYQPANSIRAASIKKSINSYQCGSDDDVAQWLIEIQRRYNDLCDMDADCMSDRTFALLILDNMPDDDSWRNYLSGLRARVRESDSHQPPLPIHSMDFIVDIRDEYWCRNKNNPQTSAHVFSAQRSNPDKRTTKRARPSDASTSGSSNKRPRAANDKMCTNSYCTSQKGHTFSECIAYTGGSQGKYTLWWRGPWNIHLPPDQRCKANNIPPSSHPSYSKVVSAMGKPAAYFVHDGPPQINPGPLQTNPQPIAYIPSQARSDTSHSNSTTDDKASIHAALSNETPFHAWSTHLDNEVLTARLPVLEESMPRSDACHHDSGATRHVFHDQSAFETYQAMHPVAVKGFGRNLTTAAIGQGTVRVLGRYGDRVTPIVLNRVLHIPAARSNLISHSQLDNAGVTAILGNGLAVLAVRGVNVVGGAMHQGMYRLNMTIVRPVNQPPRISHVEAPNFSSSITPLAAAASSDQAGFYTA